MTSFVILYGLKIEHMFCNIQSHKHICTKIYKFVKICRKMLTYVEQPF